LKCPDDDERAGALPLAQRLDSAAQMQRLLSCRSALQRLPHGDLRHYTTPLAMADADAVRAALGAERVNLVGASYGTRAALDYLRQFPQRVRRVVIDGVAPPDVALAASFSTDNQAALDALFSWCASDAACKAQHPALRAQWQALLASLPRTASVTDPFSGQPQTVTLTRHAVLDAVRNALYLPLAASALPQALAQASGGDFAPLLALPSMLGGGGGGLATGMHFSVVCSEDAQSPGPRSAPGADFGDLFERQYREVCADWPRGTLPAAFYKVPVSPAPVLVLSGAIDPATPPRHGERVARALGPLAHHTVVPNAGHGVLALACQNEVMNRFIRADTDAAALQVDASCAQDLPRPPAARALTAAGARP
jgi:pimeloyl-ACP methyl ester carboxylesterase